MVLAAGVKLEGKRVVTLNTAKCSDAPVVTTTLTVQKSITTRAAANNKATWQLTTSSRGWHPEGAGVEFTSQLTPVLVRFRG